MEGWIMADIRTSSLGSPISFTVVTSTGGSKTAEFTTPFPAGVYTIYSIAGDNDLEIYLGAEDGSNVGYSTNGNKAIVASAPFKYVTTANANSFDAIVFELYQVSSEAATLHTKTDAFWAPPVILDVTPSSLYNQNTTTVITGSNFASNAGVQFRKSDDATLVSAKSVTRTSATSITATRPDSFLTTDAPYDVIVTNPAAGLSFISSNAVTAGSAPSWTTSATLPSFQKTVAYSQSVVATDIDVSPTITYSVNSSTLPAGITFSAGTFSGTPTANSGSYSASIRATDLGGNFVDRTFTLAQDKPDAPTVNTATQTGGTTATVTFTAPAYTGTSTITSYRIVSSPAGGSGTVSQSGSGTINVTGLTNSTAYTFTVIATNSSGDSLSSSSSNSITTVLPTYTVQALIIAGGGSGGLSHGGNGGSGGGAGGVRQITQTYNGGTTLNITVGAGAQSSNTSTLGFNGDKGGNSSVASTGYTTYSSTGGGAGTHWNGAGGAGGSGGGAGTSGNSGGLGNEGGYSPVEGHNGGNGISQSNNASGGGAGGAASGNTGGPGTAAYSTWASATTSGSSGGYAGGGAGHNSGTAGAYGGGANNGNPVAHTGSGSGGKAQGNDNTAAGGIVIIRYADTIPNSTPTGNTGSSPYNTGGYKYYKFHGNGTLILP